MENCNHNLVEVKECEKCGKTFDTILPDSDCDRLRNKLRQKNEFCRFCGEDALKEIAELKQLEKQYAESLGRLAQLCDTVIPALLDGLHESQVANLPEEITAGIDEIMDYVDAVRP